MSDDMRDVTTQPDSQGRTWHVSERADGSVTVYFTLEGMAPHHVVFDTLDKDDFSQRCEKAVKDLSALSGRPGADWQRLKGKAEGVRLALGYYQDRLRTPVFQLPDDTGGSE